MDNIFIYYFISIFVEAHSRSTWSVRPCYTYASLLFKQKIIARDHRSRHPQTLSICCVLIDGDIVIQMNFSTVHFNNFSQTRVQYFPCVKQTDIL